MVGSKNNGSDMIRKLDWDSNFFDLKIGEFINIDNEKIVIQDDSFDLVYIKSNFDCPLANINYNISNQEVKITFAKKLRESNNVSNSCIFNLEDVKDFKIDDLYNLAFLSGTYSRFFKDSNISVEKFKDLYRKWVDNAVNKTFDDYFIVFKLQQRIVGMLTMKIYEGYAQVGLLAVSEDFKGKGIGSHLLMHAENYCFHQHIFEIRIPTQKENVAACNFYENKKYKIIDEKIIKHAWKINNNL